MFIFSFYLLYSVSMPFICEDSRVSNTHDLHRGTIPSIPLVPSRPALMLESTSWLRIATARVVKTSCGSNISDGPMRQIDRQPLEKIEGTSYYIKPPTKSPHSVDCYLLLINASALSIQSIAVLLTVLPAFQFLFALVAPAPLSIQTPNKSRMTAVAFFSTPSPGSGIYITKKQRTFRLDRSLGPGCVVSSHLNL